MTLIHDRLVLLWSRQGRRRSRCRCSGSSVGISNRTLAIHKDKSTDSTIPIVVDGFDIKTNARIYLASAFLVLSGIKVDEYLRSSVKLSADTDIKSGSLESIGSLTFLLFGVRFSTDILLLYPYVFLSIPNGDGAVKSISYQGVLSLPSQRSIDLVKNLHVHSGILIQKNGAPSPILTLSALSDSALNLGSIKFANRYHNYSSKRLLHMS